MSHTINTKECTMIDDPHSPLLNPAGRLLPTVTARLFEARKTKPLWAMRVEVACQVDTLEGQLQAQPGDYLCRGVVGENWPQKESKLLEKYTPSGRFDMNGWQRFDPKPDSEPVEAAPIDHPFRVQAQWGELTGKPGDYVVRSKTDPTDVWIVDKSIFEGTYQSQEPIDPQPSLKPEA